MTQPKACELDWCQSAHTDDTMTIAHHRRHLGEYRTDTATIDVVLRWAEWTDRPTQIAPHISIYMAAGDDAHVTDLTVREATIWAGQLDALTPGTWLAEKLREGAGLLAEWDAPVEFDDVPHRVTDSPLTQRQQSLLALRTATSAGRRIVREFDAFPSDAMDAMDLGGWLGRYRDIVHNLVQAIDQLEDQGVLA